MEPKERKKLSILAVLLAVLAVLGYYRFGDSPATGAPRPQEPPSQAARGRGSVPPATRDNGVPDLRLEQLSGEKPEPQTAERNPFQFKPTPPPTPIATVSKNAPPPVPTGPPPPPPIPLKFIGIVDQQGGRGKIAVLSDKGDVVYGREGDVIEGRYRILRIGAESIELSYVNGEGRQTIRLSGA